jgi:hypothetical protein
MIKLLKLITGEEVVGKMEEDGDNIQVIRPCAIMLLGSRSTPDQHQLGLIPYAAYAKEHTITIKKNMIVWESELEDEVYNQYNSLFGSGIQIVGGHLKRTDVGNTPITPEINLTQ